MATGPTKIIIHRISQYANKARGITIINNNNKLGVIKDGETGEYIVEPGPNNIQAKIDWCKTDPVKLLMKEGDTINLELGSDFKSSFNPIKTIRAIFSKDYIYLKEKQTSL